MADPKQQEALFEDDAASPYPLLGRFPKSKALSIAHTRTGYLQVPGQYSAHPSPAYHSPGWSSPGWSSPGWSSPGWSSPGLKDSFDDVRIHDLQSMQEKDTVMKQQIRRMRFFLRVFTLALAIYSLVTMAYTLKHFLDTRDHKVVIRNISTGGEPVIRGPWFKESKTWPTILLMVTSVVSLLLNVVVVVAYFKSVETANTAAANFMYIAYIIGAIHVGIWIPTAVAYRAGKNGEDLWGWSCSTKAEQIQVAFLGVVDFKRTCHIQTAAWAAATAEALLVILTFLLRWWEYRRLKHRRELQAYHSIGLRETRWSKIFPTGYELCNGMHLFVSLLFSSNDS